MKLPKNSAAVSKAIRHLVIGSRHLNDLEACIKSRRDLYRTHLKHSCDIFGQIGAERERIAKQISYAAYNLFEAYRRSVAARFRLITWLKDNAAFVIAVSTLYGASGEAFYRYLERHETLFHVDSRTLTDLDVRLQPRKLKSRW